MRPCVIGGLTGIGMAKNKPAATKAEKSQGTTRHDASYGVIPVHILAGERRYLLIQHHAGHWGFPKGHAEKGETPAQAAERELREETGLRATEVLAEPAFEEVYYFKVKATLIRKSVTYFIGFVDDPRVTPQAEEISDYAWGGLEETMKRLSFKEGRRILEQAEQALRARDAR